MVQLVWLGMEASCSMIVPASQYVTVAKHRPSMARAKKYAQPDSTPRSALHRITCSEVY